MVTGYQGDLCGYESGGAGVGDLEGQWDGAFADDEVRLACLGDREGTTRACGVCIPVIVEIYQCTRFDRSPIIYSAFLDIDNYCLIARSEPHLDA